MTCIRCRGLATWNPLDWAWACVQCGHRYYPEGRPVQYELPLEYPRRRKGVRQGAA